MRHVTWSLTHPSIPFSWCTVQLICCQWLTKKGILKHEALTTFIYIEANMMSQQGSQWHKTFCWNERFGGLGSWKLRWCSRLQSSCARVRIAPSKFEVSQETFVGETTSPWTRPNSVSCYLRSWSPLRTPWSACTLGTVEYNQHCRGKGCHQCRNSDDELRESFHDSEDT